VRVDGRPHDAEFDETRGALDLGVVESSLQILGFEECVSDCDIGLSMEVNEPFRVVPSMMQIPGLSLPEVDTVEVLDEANTVVKTISIQVSWAP